MRLDKSLLSGKVAGT